MNIKLVRQGFRQDEATDFEPRKRSQRLILQTCQSKWHVTVAFSGTLDSATHTKRRKRREDLENLCNCINYDHIKLLNDTVTELLISQVPKAESDRLLLRAMLDKESEYRPFADSLWLQVREDPSRVRYPPYEGSNVRTEDVAKIVKVQELAPGVHKVRLGGDEELYVYKEINRPQYEPRDSEVLARELLNLVKFRHVQAIINLIALIVSPNPYQSASFLRKGNPVVLRGILLEYHPHGTLQDALQRTRPKSHQSWPRWAVQITNALAHLHNSDVTHLDLKPSNVVIDKDQNAVLIDVSGIGGITWNWLAPEMRKVNDIISQDADARKLNDVWALGKMLSEMAQASTDDTEKQLLKEVAMEASSDDPTRRLSLCKALTMLSRFDQ